ncbi:MAG: Formamidopyrimidine-DNA glycosylase [Frankiales bacterium]|nr:Formamidopyrimidine-DNA glycosylase [Frankiales bacterium]
MPEGHTIHRLARDHAALIKDHPVSMVSPQGRFASGAELLSGRVLEGIEPYGKHLFYAFSGDVLLHVHLGLYGKWTTGFGAPPVPQGALRLRMTAGKAWLDLRGPTACEVYQPDEKAAVLARLGPDPLRKDADAERAWTRISRSKAPVGQLLMDQAVLAGIGNVYRAEVLFRAGLSPFLPGHDVRRPAWDTLWEDIRAVMRAGVKIGQIVTTRSQDRERRSGAVSREDAHYVYRRAGLPCRRCGTEVRTQVMAARNLFWCATCQPPP